MQGCLLAQAQGATACTTHLGSPAGPKGPGWRQKKKEQSNRQRCHGWVCMGTTGLPLLGTMGYPRPVGALGDGTALLLQHAHQHPPQVKAKVGEECKAVFCARGRQETLKESGAALEPGPLGQGRVPSAATATLLPGAHGSEGSSPLLS